MSETGTTHIYCRNYRDFKITTTEEGGLEAAGVTYSRVRINSMLPQHTTNKRRLIILEGLPSYPNDPLHHMTTDVMKREVSSLTTRTPLDPAVAVVGIQPLRHQYMVLGEAFPIDLN